MAFPSLEKQNSFSHFLYYFTNPVSYTLFSYILRVTLEILISTVLLSKD